MPNELSPVINIDKNSIVMLPLTHKAVINQAHVFEAKGAGLMAIGDDSYEELRAAIGLPNPEPEATFKHLFGRMTQHQDIKDEDKLSLLGFEGFCKYQFESGNSLDAIIIDMPDKILYWSEATPETLLEVFGVKDPQTDSQGLKEAVLRHLESDDKLSFEGMYMRGDDTYILYRVIDPIWFDLNTPA